MSEPPYEVSSKVMNMNDEIATAVECRDGWARQCRTHSADICLYPRSWEEVCEMKQVKLRSEIEGYISFQNTSVDFPRRLWPMKCSSVSRLYALRRYWA